MTRSRHTEASSRPVGGARSRRLPAHSVLLLATLLATANSCTVPVSAELGGLRQRDALGYSVWLTGGAFVGASRGADGGSRDAYAMTFDRVDTDGLPPREESRAESAPPAEAIELDVLAEVLRSADVFVRLERDPRAASERVATARGVAPGLLERVRDGGHDLVLLVRPIEDGPIEDQGINDRWPVTVLTWLAVGLGMFIPDRTFESRASMQVALVDPWSGQELFAEALGAGPVELALIDRSGLLGVALSIVVPPFWVASDREKVESRVRRESERRMALGLARRLKRAVTDEQVRARRPVAFDVTRVEGGGLRVSARAREALSFVLARVDGVPVAEARFAPFVRELLASRRPVDGSPGTRALGYRYEAVWRPDPAVLDGEQLQLVAQSVAGRVGSATLRIADL